VVNLRGQYRIARALTVFAKVNNVFDRRFETFGLLGEADEVLGDDFEDPRFVSPGAPRGVWLGIEIRL
jgi:iron complex outermembrane recepter protein